MKIVSKLGSIALLAGLACSSGCAPDKEGQATEAPPVSPARPQAEAAALLRDARHAAETLGSFAFELRLKQKLSGTENSDVSILTKGKTERNPLKLDQTIDSTIDGEQSTIRTIIVPEAYYMYLPEYEEWSKLSKAEEAENRKTLSVLQSDPGKALADMETLGGGLTENDGGQTDNIRFEGTGPEATAYVVKLLDSTIGLSSLDPSVARSVKLKRFNLLLTVDAAKHWPLSYRIESDLSLELAAGQKSELSQTVSGTYSKQDAVAAITLPQGAKEALDPDEIGKELEEGGLGEEP